MNITRIRYFIKVAETGSFSEAARKLYTAQPNLSKQIAQMEQELGFPLFIRSKRVIRLTKAGQYLYDQWATLPDKMEQDIENARNIARRCSDSLTIGVLEGQDVNQVLSCRMNSIESMFPDISIGLERNSYSNLRNGLRSGHYDLIITLDFDVEQEADIAAAVMYKKVPAIALRRAHPLANKKNLSLSDLKDEFFVVISREESPGGYERLMQSCGEIGFEPKIVREPRSLESLLLCVEMGMGVALLDQNTRLELSPYIVTVPQKAQPMAVVAACLESDDRPLVQRAMRILSGQPEE